MYDITNTDGNGHRSNHRTTTFTTEIYDDRSQGNSHATYHVNTDTDQFEFETDSDFVVQQTFNKLYDTGG